MSQRNLKLTLLLNSKAAIGLDLTISEVSINCCLLSLTLRAGVFNRAWQIFLRRTLALAFYVCNTYYVSKFIADAGSTWNLA